MTTYLEIYVCHVVFLDLISFTIKKFCAFLQEIEERLLNEGFLFICRCQTRLNRQQAEQFYSVHKGSESVKNSFISTSSGKLLKYVQMQMSTFV